jgi:Domain of unknown function (DUF5710)
MTTNTRIDLNVPYAEKDQAKVDGAQWDTENRTWYAPLAPISKNSSSGSRTVY